MKALAIANGVPDRAIVLEEHAANTHENVQFVTQLMAKAGWRSALLVSSPYHMRRALLAWRAADPSTTVVPAPVPQSQFYTHGRGASLAQIRGIIQEDAALAYYWYKGWV